LKILGALNFIADIEYQLLLRSLQTYCLIEGLLDFLMYVFDNAFLDQLAFETCKKYLFHTLIGGLLSYIISYFECQIHLQVEQRAQPELLNLLFIFIFIELIWDILIERLSDMVMRDSFTFLDIHVKETVIEKFLDLLNQMKLIVDAIDIFLALGIHFYHVIIQLMQLPTYLEKHPLLNFQAYVKVIEHSGALYVVLMVLVFSLDLIHT
jgi:hypothetical protein